MVKSCVISLARRPQKNWRYNPRGPPNRVIIPAESTTYHATGDMASTDLDLLESKPFLFSNFSDDEYSSDFAV
jgi:hypothetical protein